IPRAESRPKHRPVAGWELVGDSSSNEATTRRTHRDPRFRYRPATAPFRKERRSGPSLPTVSAQPSIFAEWQDTRRLPLESRDRTLGPGHGTPPAHVDRTRG